MTNYMDLWVWWMILTRFSIILNDKVTLKSNCQWKINNKWMRREIILKKPFIFFEFQPQYPSIPKWLERKYRKLWANLYVQAHVHKRKNTSGEMWSTKMKILLRVIDTNISSAFCLAHWKMLAPHRLRESVTMDLLKMSCLPWQISTLSNYDGIIWTITIYLCNF
jgi:hypothetical protein